MPISDKNQSIFIHLPRSAGTSISEALEMYQRGHYSVQFYSREVPEKWEEYKIFTVVRNPYDRFVSCYEYAKMDESYHHSKDGNARHGKHPDYDLLVDKSFEECVELYYSSPERFDSKTWPQQTDWLEPPVEFERECQIFRFEEDFISKIKDFLDVDVDIPHLNQSDKEKDWRKYYSSDDLARKVYMSYVDDFKNFDYNFGSYR